MPVVGFINIGAPVTSARYAAAFRAGLGESGYVAGRNVVVEHHGLEGRFDQAPAAVTDFVRRRVAVIATPAFPSGALAAKEATSTIPIVFGVGSDPVKLGPTLRGPPATSCASTRALQQQAQLEMDQFDTRAHAHSLGPQTRPIGRSGGPQPSTGVSFQPKPTRPSPRARWPRCR
jgi:putative ABC transport system substrate-binding protein